jgi:hypothetical protein
LNSDDKGEVESLEGNDSETEDMDVETLTNPEPGKKARKKLKGKQQDEETMTAEKKQERRQRRKSLQPLS